MMRKANMRRIAIVCLQRECIVCDGARNRSLSRATDPYCRFRAAGTAPDLFARHVGNKLVSSLKQPVIVDNRPGANSVIGTGMVAKARPEVTCSTRRCST